MEVYGLWGASPQEPTWEDTHGVKEPEASGAGEAEIDT